MTVHYVFVILSLFCEGSLLPTDKVLMKYIHEILFPFPADFQVYEVVIEPEIPVSTQYFLKKLLEG